MGYFQGLRAKLFGSSKRKVASFATAALIVGGSISVYIGGFPPAPTTTCNYCSYYASFSNGLPSANTFFPIEIFDACPSCGGVPYANEGVAEHAVGINVEDGIDGSPPQWPNPYGVDSGGLACIAKTNGIYVFGSNGVGTAGSGATNSVPSIDQAANSSGCGTAIAEFDVGDEGCSGAIGAQVAAIHAADPTRIANVGQAGFFPGDNSAGCITAMNASDINSGDVYETTNPYLGPTCLSGNGTQSDCLWGYGVQTARMVFHDTANHPTYIDLDSGSDNAGQSTSGGACNAATNLCPQGNERRATAEQVNSGAWETLINGANGIIWFCFDSQTAPGATPCLGAAPTSATGGEAANLTYIDGLLKNYAIELNAPNAGYCRMISDAIGGLAHYTPPYTTCSGGNLTVATSNTNEPVVAMTKAAGSTTYLFAMADHGSGTTNATYTISGEAGKTATLLYDSATHYDPTGGFAGAGSTFGLNGSGAFTASLKGDTGNAANAISYQVEIFSIS